MNDSVDNKVKYPTIQIIRQIFMLIMMLCTTVLTTIQQFYMKNICNYNKEEKEE